LARLFLLHPCNLPAFSSESSNATVAKAPNLGEFPMSTKTNNPGKTGAAIASAAALFAIASLANAATPPAGSSGLSVGARDIVHCYGVNSCKGQSECKTTAHDCKGMNSCRNQGFKGIAAGVCLRRGGTIGDIG
jgi:uncharacterized membrane protein